jgi:hypothetical protein
MLFITIVKIYQSFLSSEFYFLLLQTGLLNVCSALKQMNETVNGFSSVFGNNFL